MYRILQVKPLSEYRLEISFTNGAQGEVDLSHLAGRGVFTFWNDPEFFRQVSIGEQGQLCWGEELELCPDKLYMQLTVKTPDEVPSSG